MRVTCIKCGKEGSLMIKQTVSKDITYRYYYVKHLVSKKIKWCYIGKELPQEYQTLVHKGTQKSTQTAKNADKPKSSFMSQNSPEVLRAGSSAWYERLTCTQEDVGSNPARSTIFSVQATGIERSALRS
jgi:hypothetical protein